ncbi:MAG: phosphoenolpyruvate--protein phosphotransferase [Burkholderiaceae bacterium]|nr:phosphoenolpyruvate--protein phosphotransferase [Burkholderiaceae bacterium]
MFSIHGTGIGGGIVIGRARVLESRRFDVARYHVPSAGIEAEVVRLDKALEAVRGELGALGEHLSDDAPSEARALLEVHAMILDDPQLAQAARDDIVEQGWNAEWALASQADSLAAQFDEFEDAYLRERGRDVQQVADRVLKSLAGSGGNIPCVGEPAIIVAADIAPGDMLALRSALGFAIDLGGTTSHTAILARSMNVPAVVGLNRASELILDDEWLILDGETGVVIVAPDEPVLAEYRHRQAASRLERDKLKRLLNVPARTLDGVDVELHANIELPGEAEQARESGAAGIGLFRSEFLFMNRAELPGEDEQYEAYRAAVLAMRGLPVTIRTLDVGADKPLEQHASGSIMNPALGQRAIRYCLAEPEMFLAQLRAILRASAHGPVRLLVPMLVHAHEIDQTIRLVAQARQRLRERRIPFDERMPVGGMIEVPAAALSVSLFLRRLDFVSIGTNDLIQYTLAIDRADHSVAQLYDPFHPAVLRLIAMTIRAGRRLNKPVAVCGELAGDRTATRLLLGMGLSEFSMHPASLLLVKREILLADVSRIAPRVSRLLGSDDPERVGSALKRLLEDTHPGQRASAQRSTPG